MVANTYAVTWPCVRAKLRLVALLTWPVTLPIILGLHHPLGRHAQARPPPLRDCPLQPLG